MNLEAKAQIMLSTKTRFK